MRILLTAFGSRGDVQPMLALGLSLRERGHDIVLGGAPNYRVWTEGLGLTFREIGGDFEPWLKAQNTRNPFSILGSLAAYLRNEVPLCFEQTCAAVDRADLVVTTIHLAAHSASEAAGVPCRTVLYTPQLLPSRSHPPVAIPPQNLPGWLNHSLWWVMAQAFDLLFKGPVNRERTKLGLNPISHFLEHARGRNPIVASDAPFASIPADVDDGIVQTGALVMPVSGCLEPRVEAFLREGTPPVYVGFGSTPDSRPAETARMVSDAVRATGRRAILCGGWAGLAGFELAPEILGIDEAPHAILFPQVAAVVHHGGAGTAGAALRAGVPQVVVAHLGDQFYHGQRVQRLGVGRCIPRRRLNESRLAAAIHEVLAEPGIKAKARDLADRMRGTDGVGDTVKALLAETHAAIDGKETP